MRKNQENEEEPGQINILSALPRFPGHNQNGKLVRCPTSNVKLNTA